MQRRCYNTELTDHAPGLAICQSMKECVKTAGVVDGLLKPHNVLLQVGLRAHVAQCILMLLALLVYCRSWKDED